MVSRRQRRVEPPAQAAPEDEVRLDRHFRRTLENVALVAAGIDAAGQVTFANDYLLRLTGWSREEVIGRDWFELFSDDPVVRADYFERLAAGTFQPHFQSTIRTRAGEEREIFWSSTLLRDEHGVAEGVITIGEDVTDRHRAEELLRSREALFRSLIENASDAIGILAPDGAILYQSPAVERLLGWTPAELVGGDAFALLHEDDVDAARATFDAALRGEEPREIEIRLRHRDGSWRTFEAVARLRLEDGEPVVVGNYRDVTERRRLEVQLAHAQKLEAVGRLAGGIAHDFNNLLTAIGGYGEFLASTFESGDPRRSDALEIVAAADRAAALTGQLLAFSRRQVLETEVLDLAEVVTGLERLLSTLVGGDVELVVAVERGCLVRADRGQLEQVLTNLAVNARDAMPGGGRLDLRVGCEDGQVHLVVADTGTGMDAATRSRIFEPFFTTKEPGKGTGLGLSTVYGIVTQSGGEVFVTSEPGAGASFRLVLPLSTDAPAAAADGRRRGRPAGTESVLLVEDEETIRRLVTEVLTRDGYTVHAAATGEEALALLARQADGVDLLLTDVVMPGMSGPELARAAVERCPALRVLYTSGYASTPDEAFEDPRVEFIGKPFSPQALVTKVREVLDAD